MADRLSRARGVRLARVGALGVIIGLGVLLILFLVGILYLRSAEPERHGTFRLQGLAAAVDVEWDEYAVPRVRAGSVEDAMFAQGYLHARDRLWQMDLVRRAVAGRLAEVMGEEAVASDRFMRRLGLWAAAEESTAALTADELRLVQVYADGVNAALDGWSGAWPPEFLVLRYRPEPWEPVHTMAVAKMMALTLGSYTEATALARAVRVLGPERARHLIPAYPEWGTTTFEPIRPPEPPDTPPLAAALIEAFSVASASNAWVVSGAHTASGKPLLANDPHLQLQAPGLWYLMGLHAPAAGSRPGLDVVGATIPGAPLVILGRNRAIAWGMTNAYVKDVDIVIERVDPDDPTRYLVPGGSAPFEVSEESVHVRGRSEPELLQVRRTRHGPILPPVPGAAEDTLLAVRWTAYRPTTVFRGVLGMNVARDWDEFLVAAEAMDEPHQNLVYADTAGHIGFVMTGTVPIRGDREPPPAFPVPGWTGEAEWTGVLAFDEHPKLLDPDAGFIVTANNRQTVEAVADLIGHSWLLPFRAERITEMIRRGGGHYTAEDMLRMQLDLEDLFARRYVDRAIEAADAAGVPDVADRLREWHHRAGPHSRAASVFYIWCEVLRRLVSADLHRGEASYFPWEPAAHVLESRSLPWRMDGEEAYRRAATEAMRQAVRLADDRRWSDLNRAVHAHPLGIVPILDRLLQLNVGPRDHYGSPHTVNVALWAFRTPAASFPFTTTAGVSMRHVADLGNTERAGGFVIGTGQAGVPFSRHYADQHDLWVTGGLIPLPAAVADRPGTRPMRLEPGHR